MGRYLLLWEVDKARIPVDRKERGVGWGLLMSMVRQDREKGISKDWGTFVGETNGYDVVEGTEIEILKMTAQYVPYVSFKAYPIASESQVNEMIKALSG
ncbi:MAG: hypothetical protein KAY32_12380 [Candidatus Eisenbacteria sp.]|nr:hypothetical protein [Candidatus Eisenbacteria bacterium]